MKITSHTLNSYDGTHAGNIPVTLNDKTSNMVLCETTTDEGGRVSIQLDEKALSSESIYELAFETGDYWRARNVEFDSAFEFIVLRFTITDLLSDIHMPVILGPHGYSTWKSS